MSGTPLDWLKERLDPGACHLIKLPDRVWVFGGPLAERLEPATSFRDHLLRRAFESIGPRSATHSWLSRLDQPENYPEWWAFSGYGDLLEFERDACHLCQAVVLIAESEGSLVELGALAADSHLSGRVLVVVQQKYVQGGMNRSFINLGPLRRLDQNVCYIGAESKENLPQEDFEVILEFVSARLSSPHRRELLQPGNPTHQLLMLADLVDLCQIIREGEAQELLTHFGISISEKLLRQYTQLLHFFGLLVFTRRGDHRFLSRSASSKAPWVDYRAAAGQKPFDRARFKVDSHSFAESDAQRKSVLGRPR